MNRIFCCSRDMGAVLSQQELVDSGGLPPPTTMADLIRERKKKYGGGMSTLRRRLAAVRRARPCGRQDRDCEHARHMRQLVANWSPAEVGALHEEYETLHTLRDLSTQADLARCPAGTLHADLAALYTQRYCGECTLVWRGSTFTVHRTILAARCSYFRDVLNNCPSQNARIVLDRLPYHLSAAELDYMFLLIYAGEEGLRAVESQISSADGADSRPSTLDIVSADQAHNGRLSLNRRLTSAQIMRLSEQFGFRTDGLHRDMGYLLTTGEYADAALVFASEGQSRCDYGFRSKLELPCHKAILAARSPFFRNLVSRRSCENQNAGQSGGGGSRSWRPTTILRVSVDEAVLPRRFAAALLHAAYTDQLDLSLVVPAATTAAGGSNADQQYSAIRQIEDACQLYEIASFLEMAILVQGCEDAIVNNVNAETLSAVLSWSSQQHASHWVYRQAMRYLCDEFVSICCSGQPCTLERQHLMTALSSDYLQASEAQALKAIIKWGERYVSTSVCSSKRRSPPADSAVREAIAPLLALVRTEHILPQNNELLQQAVRRGLISQPPTDMVEARACDRWLARGPYRSPRLLLPYYDEIKALLENQHVSESEIRRIRRGRYHLNIPDTLYMVNGHENSEEPSDAESTCPELVRAVEMRTRALLSARRTLHPQKHVVTLLALRAARELGLPDSVARAVTIREMSIPQHDPRSDGENEEEEQQVLTEESSGRRQLGLDVCAGSPSTNAGNASSFNCLQGGQLSEALPDVAAVPAVTSCVTSSAASSSGVPRHSRALLNANTHLLSAPYCRAIFTPWRELGACGGVMQLDLGDGTTHHPPKPGSRASRLRRQSPPASSAMSTHQGMLHQHLQGNGHHRPASPVDDGARAAVDLTLMQGYNPGMKQSGASTSHPSPYQQHYNKRGQQQRADEVFTRYELERVPVSRVGRNYGHQLTNDKLNPSASIRRTTRESLADSLARMTHTEAAIRDQRRIPHDLLKRTAPGVDTVSRLTRADAGRLTDFESLRYTHAGDKRSAGYDRLAQAESALSRLTQADVAASRAVRASDGWTPEVYMDAGSVLGGSMSRELSAYEGVQAAAASSSSSSGGGGGGSLSRCQVTRCGGGSVGRLHHNNTREQLTPYSLIDIKSVVGGHSGRSPSSSRGQSPASYT